MQFSAMCNKKAYEIIIMVQHHNMRGISKPGGGGGVLRCCLDGGARLKPPNLYPSLRVILAERVSIIRDFS